MAQEPNVSPGRYVEGAQIRDALNFIRELYINNRLTEAEREEARRILNGL